MLILITIIATLTAFTTAQWIASRHERRALESAMDAIRKEENRRFIQMLESI